MTVVLLLGGLSYLYTATFIISDKNTCKMQTQGKFLLLTNQSEYVLHLLGHTWLVAFVI